ncbi:MFS transporter [Geodermatophilus sabuli]|uniref:Predicted arabinose efflux permease, MFS family n=1 Tax=Geodermatophilus sabuli TaxID=1564158 RepID=A0A285ELV3_9ACTN|nr:MFS transporter [Geodermatophilus sabuli]MBB3083636.1 MFS family permease [Geodermatophilus sabuli]SNX99066.1 Predicted arabinose efflux permease, MFS family [Geodermatophilus sabuli]
MSEQVTTPAQVVEEPLAGEVAVDPATGRPAGRPQALVLLLSSCLAVLGSVLLAPVLPRIQDAFAGTPGVEALTPIVLTAPALVIGLTAMVAGRIVDRVGRKRLLVSALVVYAFAGTAPLWLDSLQLIVASRVLVGLTEAAIMTCCTTLLADYFHGSQRERYFGLQVVFTTVAATVFFGLGGALGAQDWRTPFWLYAVSLPLAALAVKYVWQPAPQAAARTAKLAPLPWRPLLAPVGVSLLGGLVFYVLIVELSFVLDGIGVESTGTIGAVSAIGSLGTAAGGFLFARIARLGPAVTVPAAFALSGVGLIGLGLAGSLPMVVVCAVVTGFGNGLLLPAMLSWALGSLSFEQRGRGTGFWTSAMFIGQFICPLLVLGLSDAISGLDSALMVLGAVAVVAALGVRLARPVGTSEPVTAAH